jgi:hypothetical protein
LQLVLLKASGCIKATYPSWLLLQQDRKSEHPSFRWKDLNAFCPLAGPVAGIAKLKGFSPQLHKQ